MEKINSDNEMWKARTSESPTMQRVRAQEKDGLVDFVLNCNVRECHRDLRGCYRDPWGCRRNYTNSHR